MYLSNEPGNPTKHVIAKDKTAASTKIAPSGYLVVWCDKLEQQSQLHAPFKLPADGGFVSITAPDESWTDSLTYELHTGTETVGRYPDGSQSVYLMNVPTIGLPNRQTSYMAQVEQPLPFMEEKKMEEPSGHISIRYVVGRLKISNVNDTDATLTIMSLSGQALSTTQLQLVNGMAEVSCYHMPVGCYIAIVTDQSGNSQACKFILNF